MSRFYQLLITCVLAAIVGHYLWLRYGPTEQPQYVISHDGLVLAGVDPSDKHLYLRHTIILTQPSRHAWIELLSRDTVALYVNDQQLALREADGYTHTLLQDITPYLRKGKNVIAISVSQAIDREPPRVAVRGQYELAGTTHSIEADHQWRANSRFDRDGFWWFNNQFDDSKWPSARLVQEKFVSESTDPPRAVSQPSQGKWITPVGQDKTGVAAMRREFQVPSLPREAWLRVSATSAYRLAVNGHVIDEQETRLGIAELPAPTLRAYDLSPLVRMGKNTISLWLTCPTTVPHVLLDLEVLDANGNFTRLASDESWTSVAGVPEDWFRLNLASESKPAWAPSIVETGDLGNPPWTITRRFVNLSLPARLQMLHYVWRISLTAILAAAIWMSCLLASQLLRVPPAHPDGDAAFLCLLPTTLVLVAGWLASFDPRVSVEPICRSPLLLFALGAIPVQWLVLAIFRWPRGVSLRDLLPKSVAGFVALLLGLSVVSLSFALRIKNYTARELGADEVHMYRCTMGCLERGFPSYVVSDDMPVQWVATSALVYIGPTIVAQFTDNPLVILRLPSVFWGTLTTALLVLAGRRMFSTLVGLLAATMYAISPVCIAMANFGRYPSQLQFMTLLSVYFLWKAIEHHQTLNRRYLWLTTLAFIGVYMSWQAAVFLGIGMAAATIYDRRGQLHTVFGCDTLWKAAGVVVFVILAQSAQRAFIQSARLEYGMGASETALMPMWRQANFELWRFVRQSSWTENELLPLAALLTAFVLTLRHAWQRSTQTLVIILLVTAWPLALLLPITAGRYAYFLSPISILLAATAIVAAARAARLVVRFDAAPAVWRMYGNAVAGVVIVAGVALFSELTARFAPPISEMEEREQLGLLTSRSLAGPSHFLAQNWQPGDVVLATQPYLVEHHVQRGSHGARELDTEKVKWLQTRLHLQSVLADHDDTPLNRRDGTPVIATPQELEEFFSKHDRIWYVVSLRHHDRLNLDSVSAYLRQNMEVAYEDVESLVLLRDNTQHRPAILRLRDEAALKAAETTYLP